ncbi:MAG TPA: non-heme iron oxygenase ferredoxin subunit, partial [Candidatus Dadabacteria bacterium]|nr:non-heme iron oxygenase ferredoxin subunit [Candidatus Dadabacteria bacterium]
MSNLLKVCNISEIPVDTLLKKDIEGNSVILIKKNDSIYAIENQCSHMNYPLDDGELNQYEIECIH